MIEFGKTLRDAREAKGYTISQLAEKTRIMPSMIEDLENENFSRLPAPIYGRGFIKLYCEAVELDAKPLIAEFMEILNGSRDFEIRDRLVSNDKNSAEPPICEEISPAPKTSEPEVHSVAQGDFFNPSAENPEPISSIRFAAEDDSPDAPTKPRFTSYSEPISSRFEAVPKMNPAIFRWMLVGVVAALIIWGSAVGIASLYRVTKNYANDETSTEISGETKSLENQPQVETKTTEAQPIGESKRTPIEIPPLYFD